jgi:hypothetical protein
VHRDRLGATGAETDAWIVVPWELKCLLVEMVEFAFDKSKQQTGMVGEMVFLLLLHAAESATCSSLHTTASNQLASKLLMMRGATAACSIRKPSLALKPGTIPTAYT